MKFLISNWRKAEGPNEVTEPHVWISIATPGMRQANVRDNQHTLAVLYQDYGDWDELHFERSPELREKAMSHEQAVQVIEFVTEWEAKLKKGVELTVVCQCEAGISRSTGLALGLSMVFCNEEFRRGLPNAHVTKTVLRAAARIGLIDRV